MTRRTSIARGPASGVADAAAKPDAMIRPTGVAIANPMFGLSSITPGVARAWSPRNPALERNASEIRVSRASWKRPGREVRDVGEDHVDRGSDEHDPEMSRMVLQCHVELGLDDSTASPTSGRMRTRPTGQSRSTPVRPTVVAMVTT